MTLSFAGTNLSAKHAKNAKKKEREKVTWQTSAFTLGRCFRNALQYLPSGYRDAPPFETRLTLHPPIRCPAQSTAILRGLTLSALGRDRVRMP